MESSKLFAKCTRELDVVESVFRAQKRDDDFSEFRHRLEKVKPQGKGRPMLDILIDLKAHIDSLNVRYIEGMTGRPLSLNQHRLLDAYLTTCSGKEIETTYTPTAQEAHCLETAKKLHDTVKSGNNITQDLIELSADLELEIFRIIATKN
jgi:hypothetical protein